MCTQYLHFKMRLIGLGWVLRSKLNTCHGFYVVVRTTTTLSIFFITNNWNENMHAVECVFLCERPDYGRDFHKVSSSIAKFITTKASLKLWTPQFGHKNCTLCCRMWTYLELSSGFNAWLILVCILLYRKLFSISLGHLLYVCHLTQWQLNSIQSLFWKKKQHIILFSCFTLFVVLSHVWVKVMQTVDSPLESTQLYNCWILTIVWI